ncbi:MAG: diguanylate cyclase [Pseudohongiellaceae bacterium]
MNRFKIKQLLIPICVIAWALSGLYLSITAFFIGSTLLLSSASALLALKLSLNKTAKTIVRALELFKTGERSARISVPATDPFDEMGPLCHALNNLLDETEAEEWRLNEKRIRYKSLVEMMADGLITISCNGRIESQNFAAGKMLGFQDDELIGQELAKFVLDPKASDPEAYLNSFIKSSRKDSPNQEVELRRKDGSTLPSLFSVSAMETHREKLYIAVITDISKIKTMETQLRTLNKELLRTNERLEKTAITDSLTSLYNRRHFDSALAKELNRSTRQHTSLSLLIVDIDFFKQFNDIYGHTAGDECIRKVSTCIKQVFKRSGDLPARYGGEEFAVILPGCDGLELQERAETLRKEVEALAIPHRGSSAESVLTISIGAVTYKPENSEVSGPKPKEIFSAADKALYQAKAKGRNQVVFAGQFQPIQIPSITAQLYGQFMSR